MQSLPFHAGSSRSSQVAGFLPPTSLFRRSVFQTNPMMPVYQPVQNPFGSLNSGLSTAALGDTYFSSSPSLPSGSWNSLDPPMKMSAFGDAFSARIRVCRSPAAASGNRSMFDPGYAALNAALNWLFVVSFSAEYTVMLPVGFAAAAVVAAACVPAGADVAAPVPPPPHAASAAAEAPSPMTFRNARRS